MEYLIEENELNYNTTPEIKKIPLVSDNNINLANLFHINPEYMEFVRNHAIRGGTGEIQFPLNNSNDTDSFKRPRFISRVIFC